MQQPLWHEHFEDALNDIVASVGGPKRLASQLWPDKPIADAARLLRHCLDPSRPEKLELSQVLFVMRKGREADCHTAMHYLAAELGYEAPKPISPETEQQRLQREFIAAQQQIVELARRMDSLTERAPHLRVAS